MGSKLFVGSLAYSVTSEELQKMFQEYGNVVSSKVISDQSSGRSKGFGFVEMEVGDQAQKAIDGLNGNEVCGRTLHVSVAREQTYGRNSYS